jgi:ABC-type transport system substrate-binding protein
MEKGDYSIYHYPATGGSDAPIANQQTYNADPTIGELVRTQDFREAISYAVDADAINEGVFVGLGSVQNWVPHPSTPYYPGPEWAALYTQYDPDKANQMLDTLGLTAKDGEGYRLRPDGSGERLVLELAVGPDESLQVAELMQGMMNDVGLEIEIEASGQARSDILKNQGYWGVSIDTSAYQANPWSVDWTRQVPLRKSHNVAQLIGEWVETQGASGMAPGPDPSYLPLAPAENFAADPSGNLRNLIDIWQGGRSSEYLSPTRIEMGKEIFEINCEELYISPMWPSRVAEEVST